MAKLKAESCHVRRDVARRQPARSGHGQSSLDADRGWLRSNPKTYAEPGKAHHADNNEKNVHQALEEEQKKVAAKKIISDFRLSRQLLRLDQNNLRAVNTHYELAVLVLTVGIFRWSDSRSRKSRDRGR